MFEPQTSEMRSLVRRLMGTEGRIDVAMFVSADDLQDLALEPTGDLSAVSGHTERPVTPWVERDGEALAPASPGRNGAGWFTAPTVDEGLPEHSF